MMGVFLVSMLIYHLLIVNYIIILIPWPPFSSSFTGNRWVFHQQLLLLALAGQFLIIKGLKSTDRKILPDPY